MYFLFSEIALIFSACVMVNNNRRFQGRLTIKGDTNVLLEKVVVGSMLNHYLIIVCSYIDEWNSHFNENAIPAFQNRIRRVKTISKPAMKEISKWSGLRDFRNVVLAHNLRGKGGTSIFSGNAKINNNIPSDPTETLLLFNLLDLVNGELMKEFVDLDIRIDPDLLAKEGVGRTRQIDPDQALAHVTRLMDIERSNFKDAN